MPENDALDIIDDPDGFIPLIREIASAFDQYENYLTESKQYKKRKNVWDTLPPAKRLPSLQKGIEEAKQAYGHKLNSFSAFNATISEKFSQKLYSAFKRVIEELEKEEEEEAARAGIVNGEGGRAADLESWMRDMEARLGLPGLLLNKTCYMTRDTALREFETRMKAEAGTVRMSMRDAIRAMEAEDKAVQEQLRQRLEQIQEEAETRQYASLDQRLLETALRACEEASAAGCCAGTGIRGRVANAVDEALDAMMRRVEPVYRTLHTSKRLTTIEAGVKAVDEQLLRLLRKEPTEQQWTEAATLFHALEQVHRETEALKTAIAQLVEKNKALEAAYVSRRLRMLETRHQQLNTHMEQLQRSVLRPGFGERLDDLLSEYTQVMSNHDELIRYLVDPIASSKDEHIDEQHLEVATQDAPLSYPLQNAVEKLAMEAMSRFLDEASQRLDLLEKRS